MKSSDYARVLAARNRGEQWIDIQVEFKCGCTRPMQVLVKGWQQSVNHYEQGDCLRCFEKPKL